MDFNDVGEKGRGESGEVKSTPLKPIKPMKHEIIEGTSCQQELMRIRKVKLPDHQPDCIDIANFLRRVPALPTSDDKKKVARSTESDNGKLSRLEIDKLLAAVCKLQKPIKSSSQSIVSDVKDDSIIFEEGLQSHLDCKELNSFFERLQKHTSVAKHQELSKNSIFEKAQQSINTPDCKPESLQSVINCRKVIGTSETPGAGLQELKSQLQQQMKAIRDIHRQEAMYKHRLENEYFDDEEEEFWTTGDVTDRIDSNSKNEYSNQGEDKEFREWNEHETENHVEMKSTNFGNADIGIKNSVASESSFLVSNSEDRSLVLFPDDEAANCKYEKSNTVLPELDDSSRAHPVIGEDVHLSLDDNSQFSQVLDTQGYFNPRRAQLQRSNASPSPVLEFISVSRDSSSTEVGKLRDGISRHCLSLNSEGRDDSQDLLKLCSGSFNGPVVKESGSSKTRSIVAKLLDQCNTEETESQIMLGLCSGKFGSPSESQAVGTHGNIEDESTTVQVKKFGLPDTDVCDPVTSFEAVPNNERHSPYYGTADECKCLNHRTNETVCEEKDIACDCSGACLHPSGYQDLQGDVKLNGGMRLDPEDHCSNDTENEEDLDSNEHYDSFVRPKKFSKAQFYEEEAELSGSDVGDDENDDLDSELDEYESDSEIEDLPSESKLKAQVHKAHMKATLADDKQDIRVIQERFYEDGDLLLGSLGRRRNYKWHNIDNIANANTSSDESELDDEGDAGFNSPSIHQSAVERLEREAFCEEQSKLDKQLMLDENSQSILNIISDKGTASDQAVSQHKPSLSFKRQGSFLDRDRSTLTRLSSVTSNHSKLHTLPRSFVFQVNSRNRSSSASLSKKSQCEQPHPKKAKLEPPLSSPPFPSIFGSL